MRCLGYVIWFALVIPVLFRLSPMLGLAVFILSVAASIYEVVNEGREEKEKKAEKAEEKRIRIEEQRLEIEGEKLRVEKERLQAELQQNDQQIRVQAIQMYAPDLIAKQEREAQLMDAFFNELKVMEESQIIRHHGSLERLDSQQVLCENEHKFSYANYHKSDGVFGCPSCDSIAMAFEGEVPGRFRFCENRVRGMGFDTSKREYAFIHAYDKKYDACPLCTWSTQNGIKVQPHNFSLHERSDDLTVAPQNLIEDSTALTELILKAEELRSADIVRFEEDMDPLPVTCANEHKLSWKDLVASDDEPDSDIICPQCHTSLLSFDDIEDRSYFFCTNLIFFDDDETFNQWRESAESAHWFADNYEACPFCTWAIEHEYDIDERPLEVDSYNRQKLKL